MRRYFKHLFVLLVLFLSTVIVFSQTYNIPSTATTYFTCTGAFYDSGGSGGNYTNNQNRTVTFCSSNTAQSIYLDFSQFNIENYWDYMYIYDGPNTASPLLGTYTGTNSPGIILAQSGCITIRFTSDGSVTRSGWAAIIGCGTPVLPPPPPTPPPCTITTPAGNTCATVTPICDFNGYCGNTSSSYTVNSWWQLTNAFCGSIENNSFFSFVAGAATVSLDVWVSNCTNNSGGIQFMIFSSSSVNQRK